MTKPNKPDKTIAKKLHDNYRSCDLLQAFLLYNAEVALKYIYCLDEKDVKDNYEKVASIMFDKVELLKNDNINKSIIKYLKSVNLLK